VITFAPRNQPPDAAEGSLLDGDLRPDLVESGVRLYDTLKARRGLFDVRVKVAALNYTLAP